MLISSKKSYECAELKHVKQYPGCPGHSEQKEITLRTFLSISLYPNMKISESGDIPCKAFFVLYLDLQVCKNYGSFS